MFYADQLSFSDSNGQKLPGNYSLDYDKSSCTQSVVIINNQNITSAMYVFLKQNKKKQYFKIFFVFSLDLFWDNGVDDTVETMYFIV